MSPSNRSQIALYLSVGVGLLLAACQSATPVALVAPPATNTVVVRLATQAPSATNTLVPNTATAPPTATNTATTVPSPTVAPSATASPTAAPTDTPLPTATATATAKPTAKPKSTSAPATVAPTAQPAPVSDNIYSSTGGPAGYFSGIKCKRGNAPCTSQMAPGDINFDMALGSDVSSPWTNFVKYGLSVERDGANVADMFMFVDAGWLQPGRIVGFGTSRNFSQPGTYVIRSSGCMTTDQGSSNCGWSTISGTVVTFVIQ